MRALNVSHNGRFTKKSLSVIYHFAAAKFKNDSPYNTNRLTTEPQKTRFRYKLRFYTRSR